MADKELLDFQKDWEILVDKGFADYKSLTSDERTWFNTEILISAVENGGIIGHYCNYGAENNKETIEDLNSLGFPDISALLMRVNKLFPGEFPPVDAVKRNEIISGWPDGEYDELLEELDEEFSNRADDLEKKLVEFILAKGLSQ